MPQISRDRLVQKGQVVNPSEGKIRWQSVLRLLAMALMCLFVFCRFIPGYWVKTSLRYDNGDNSWTEALHVAFVQHMQFGTDVVFTYGPWGFLGRGYHPGTYLIAVISWTVLTSVFLIAGWRLARRFSGKWYWSVLWLMLFAFAASIELGEDFDMRVTAFCILLLFSHFFLEERKVDVINLVLAVCLGWLSLVKFNALISSLAVVGVIAADNVLRQRRFPWALAAWLAAVIVFWMAAAQHLGTLPLFLWRSFQVAGGYTDAMALPDSGPPVARALICALMTLLLSGLVGRLAWPQRKFFAVLPAAGLGAMLFMAFKSGYIRTDWKHEPNAAMALMLAALACLAVASPMEKRVLRDVRGVFALATAFAAMVICIWFSPEWRAFTNSLNPVYFGATVSAPFSGFLKGEYKKMQERNRYSLSPLPWLNGGTDLYSYEQSLLFGSAMRYQPRPVIQSYSAFTLELAKLDAEHLRATNAAENILFGVETIDDRYPSLDDGLSWPELLTRYDLKGVADPGGFFLMLLRTAAPRQFRLIPLTNTVAHFGRAIAVPATTNGPIWVEIDLRKTLAGKLASFLYKTAPITMVATLPDHKQRVFRLIPGVTGSGFLLSPMVLNTRAFAELASGEHIQNNGEYDVESITIAADSDSGSTICYGADLPVRFYRLEFPPQDFKWPLKWPARE